MWVLVRTHNLCFEQKYEKSKNTNQLKIAIFSAVKNGCILYGLVFVMTLEFCIGLSWNTLSLASQGGKTCTTKHSSSDVQNNYMEGSGSTTIK